MFIKGDLELGLLQVRVTVVAYESATVRNTIQLRLGAFEIAIGRRLTQAFWLFLRTLLSRSCAISVGKEALTS